MKKIIALFSIIGTLVLAACSVGSHSVSSGMADEGYVWFVSETEKAITVDIDGTTYQTQTIKEKEWQKRRDIKATTQGMITVVPGKHTVKVLVDGQEVYVRTLYISASESKKVKL